eukprot:279058_1
MLSDDDRAPLFPAKHPEESTSDVQKTQNTKQNKRIISLTNLPFIYFIIGAILSIVCSILYIMNNNIGYIISGIIGFIICTFAIKHFRTLINLKIKIDEFYQLNVQFRKQHNILKTSVNKLNLANKHLSDTHNRLKLSNQKNRDNLIIFRGIQYNMEQFNAQTVSELTNILNKVSNIEQRWHEELYKQERRMLYTVFDRFCSYQNHIGITEKEFKQFVNELPESYQERFGNIGTFKKLSGNKSIILLEDFANTLDIFAEMQTSNIDIEFQVKQTNIKRKINLKHCLKQRKTQYFSKRQQSYILNAINEHEMMKNDDEKLIDNNDYDDREYDKELLTYESQIIITNRTTPKRKITQSIIIPSPDNIICDESTLDQWLERETMSPITPMLYNAPVNPYYKANIFEHNKKITDVSLNSLDINKQLSITSTSSPPPPKLESMNTTDIEQSNFTDQQMNKYMQKIQKTTKD